MSALLEQGRLRMVDRMDLLELEMAELTTNGYAGEGWPLRLEAMVTGCSYLMERLFSPSVNNKLPAWEPRFVV